MLSEKNSISELYKKRLVIILYNLCYDIYIKSLF